MSTPTTPISDMSPTQMKEYLAQLQAENVKLKEKKTIKLSTKVTERGGLSVYGLQRFPVTLYKGQWLALFAGAEEIKKILLDPANASSLKEKE